MVHRRVTIPYRKGKPGVKLTECSRPDCYLSGPWEHGTCPQHTNNTIEGEPSE